MYQMYRIHMEELQIHKNDAEYCEKQALIKDISYMRMEGVEKYFSKKLRKRKTLSEGNPPLKASVLVV